MAAVSGSRRKALFSPHIQSARTALGAMILIAVMSSVVRASEDKSALAAPEQESAKANSGPDRQPPSQSKEGEGSGREAAIRPAPASPNDKDATSVNAITGLGMVSSIDYKPLTRHQRWEFYINQNFTSVGSYFGPVVSSIIDQSSGQPPEWGGGFEGYGKRLGSRIGTGVIQGTVQSAGAAALGQEPRYIRSADSGVFHRIGHAFVYTLITYNNEGKKRPALATLSSYYVSSMLTNAWYPDRYTALGDGVRDGNRQVILAGLINQFQEFWPEIRRYVFRRK